MGGLSQGGIPIGSVFGIPIKVHWTFLALVLLLGPGADWFMWVLFGILFISVFIHELGHCAAARGVGGQAVEIIIWPLGGLALTTGGRTVWQQMWVTLAGPLMHLPIAWVAAQLLSFSGAPLTLAELSPFDYSWVESGRISSLYQVVLYLTFKLQVLLFCFNMCLPAYPMDGGQLVAAVLSRFFSLENTLAAAGLLTLGTSAYLFQNEIYFIGAWLAFEGVKLLSAAAGAGTQWHPIARYYGSGTIEMKAPVFVEPGLELVACANCGNKMHPNSEVCVECGQVVT